VGQHVLKLSHVDSAIYFAPVILASPSGEHAVTRGTYPTASRHKFQLDVVAGFLSKEYNHSLPQLEVFRSSRPLPVLGVARLKS
jgi:hypothetical protein